MALVSVARILSKPDGYPSEIAVAAGQAAIALGYYGAPTLWRSLYDIAGDHAVPTVIGGLARADWKALLAWLDEHRYDAWIERTVINLLPSFLITQGGERVSALTLSIWPSTSELGQNEIRSFAKRKGLEFEFPETASDPTRTDWHPIIRGVFSDGLSPSVQEAGGVVSYVQAMVAARGRDSTKEFTAVLNQTLRDWRLLPRLPDNSADMAVDLIAAFRPERGATQLVDFLENGITNLSNATIHKALAAMSQYYQKPPPSGTRDRTYTRYVHVLRKAVAHHEVGRSALDALLRLNAIDFKDKQFAATVVRHDEKQRQVVDFVVATDWNLKPLCWLLDASVRESSPEQPAVYERLIANFRRHGDKDFHVGWQSVILNSDVTVTIAPELSLAHAKLFQRMAARTWHTTYNNLSKD
jgi:hypothetical protein